MLEELFNDAYSSIEDYIEECFVPVNELTAEWGLKSREPFDIEFYKNCGNSFFDTVNSVKNHALEDLQTVQGQTRDISIKNRHAPSNIQTVDADSVRSMLKEQFHAQTPDGNYDAPLVITKIDSDSVSSVWNGRRRYTYFMKICGIDSNGNQKNFVLSQDDLEHRSLDKSPQKVKKLEVGDMISVNLSPPLEDDMHHYIPQMRGLSKAQSLFLVMPVAFFDVENKSGIVIDGRIEEYGKVVLHGDWPTRQVTLSDASGNKGTFTLPGNADFDHPNANKGDRVVGVASRSSGRLSVLRPV